MRMVRRAGSSRIRGWMAIPPASSSGLSITRPGHQRARAIVRPSPLKEAPFGRMLCIDNPLVPCSTFGRGCVYGAASQSWPIRVPNQMRMVFTRDTSGQAAPLAIQHSLGDLTSHPSQSHTKSDTAVTRMAGGKRRRSSSV